MVEVCSVHVRMRRSFSCSTKCTLFTVLGPNSTYIISELPNFTTTFVLTCTTNHNSKFHGQATWLIEVYSVHERMRISHVHECVTHQFLALNSTHII